MARASEHSALIDRARELADLERLVAARRPALALVVGSPKIGKSRLLAELARRALEAGCSVVPPVAATGYAERRLLVDRATTVDEFQAMVCRDAGATSVDADAPPSTEVLLVHQYQPSASFAWWFAERFVTDFASDSPARIVVVAGYESDLGELEARADLKVTLGPLAKPAVEAFLDGFLLAGSLELTEREREQYAALASVEPSYLEPLTRLLRLDAETHKGAPAA